MPRYLNNYRYRASTKDLLERRRTSRASTGDWIDPYPDILGTKPEKLVYAQLKQRRIPFMFQTHFRVQVAGIDDWYRPDFILPDRKIIIEVQGAYFHLQPDQIKKDAFKYALYDQMGYKVLAWMDYDILSNVFMLFGAEPTLGWTGGERGGRIITENQQEIDDSKGIRTGNTLRAEYLQASQRSSYAKRRDKKYTPISSYTTSF